MSKERKIILFTPYSKDNIAHVTRSLEIANGLRESLRERGQNLEIVFGLDDEYKFRSLIQERRFRIYPLPNIDVLESVRKANLDVYTKDSIAYYVEKEIELIREINPIAIVNDTHWTINISSRVCEIPLINITNAIVTRYNSLPIRAPENHPITKVVGQRLADRLAGPLTKYYFFPKTKEEFDTVRKKFGLAPMNHLWEVNEGDLTLIVDAPELFPLTQTPPHVIPVGPLALDVGTIPHFYHQLNPKRTVYISASATGNLKQLSKHFEELGESPFTIVLATGGQFVPSNLKFPDNFYVVETVHGTKMLEASIATVNTGSNPTVHQNLLLESPLPMVMAPGNTDQEWHARRFAELGLGRYFSLNRSRKGDLIKAIEVVIADKILQATQKRYSKILREYNPVRSAVTHIVQFLNL